MRGAWAIGAVVDVVGIAVGTGALTVVVVGAAIAWATVVVGAAVVVGVAVVVGAAVVVGVAVVVGAAVVVGVAVKTTSTVSTVVRSTEQVDPGQPGVLHEENCQPDPGLAESEAVVGPSTSIVQSSVHEEPPDLVTVPPPVTRTRSERAGTKEADAVDAAAGVVDPGSR